MVLKNTIIWNGGSHDTHTSFTNYNCQDIERLDVHLLMAVRVCILYSYEYYLQNTTRKYNCARYWRPGYGNPRGRGLAGESR